MNTKASNILVPTDFSPVAECAIIHACTMAKQTQDQVKLLHVVNKESLGELKKHKLDIVDLRSRLDKQCNYYAEKYGVTITYLIKEGSIFTEIGEAADKEGSQLIVMGTHGVKGMQHLTGAFALKVVANSKVPVIIVQHKMPKSGGYTNIVSPIDFSVETKQKTLQTISVANLFKAKVHIFKQVGYDESVDNKIKLNAQFVKRHMEQQNIDITEVIQKDKKADFSKEFLAYAKEIDADLIVILTTAEKGVKDIVLGTEEQRVINNAEEIPVMCVNPLQNLYKTESLSSIANLSF